MKKYYSRKGKNEVFHDKSYLICFADTLSIPDKCNFAKDPHQNIAFGSNFEFPHTITKGTFLDRPVIFGEDSFEVTELEVFQCF